MPDTPKTQATSAEAKPRSGQPRRLWLYLVVSALSAACGLIVEIVAGRIIAPYLGMSLYTWTAVIAVVLAGFSLGNWIGGRFADRPPEQAAAATAWSLALAALATFAALPLLRLLAGPLIALELSAVPTILILTSALFFAPSVFVGIPSPVLTKLALDEHAAPTGRVIGLFFAVGAVGSIIGTLAAGYIFISWLGSSLTLIVVALLYAALAMIMALDARCRTATTAGERASPSVRPWMKTGSVLALSAGALLSLAVGHKTNAFQSNCDEESDYYCIRVRDAGILFGSPARVLVLDHLGHGINLEESPTALVSAYAELQSLFAAPRQSATGAAFTAFFIGGGAFTLPRAWLTHSPNAKITVAEIDPEVTRVAKEQLWLPADADNLRVIHRDARRTLRDEIAAGHRYDVIVGDAFHDIAVPPHLVTEEFYREIRSALKPGGLYVMNVIDNPDRPRLAASVHATLSEVFPSVEVWVSNEPAKRATFVLRAAQSPSPKSFMTSKLQPDLAWQRLSAAQIAAAQRVLKPVVLTDDHAPVDRLIGLE